MTDGLSALPYEEWRWSREFASPDACGQCAKRGDIRPGPFAHRIIWPGGPTEPLVPFCADHALAMGCPGVLIRTAIPLTPIPEGALAAGNWSDGQWGGWQAGESEFDAWGNPAKLAVRTSHRELARRAEAISGTFKKPTTLLTIETEQ